MTRKPFVVANWKMNGSLKANDEWLCTAMPQMSGTRLNCDVAVCAPFVYIPQLVIGFEHSATLVGAQNCAQYAQGAYTGEVSAAMLADVGCDLVILGHSERRTLFGETDETVAEKVQVAFDNGVMPIVCVGETLQEREAGKTIEVVSRQLRAVLDKVGIMPWPTNLFGPSVLERVPAQKTHKLFIKLYVLFWQKLIKKQLSAHVFFMAVVSKLRTPRNYLRNPILTVHWLAVRH